MHLLEVLGGHHPVHLVAESHLVGVGQSPGIAEAVLLAHHRPVMGVEDLAGIGLERAVLGVLDLDGDRAADAVAPSAIVAILVGIVGIERFLEDVGRVGTAGGHSHRHRGVVPQGDEGEPHDGHAGQGEFPPVHPHLVEAEGAVEAEMRVDHRDGHARLRLAGGEGHLIGAVIGDLRRLDAAGLQIVGHLAQRPAPNHRPADGNAHPRLDLEVIVGLPLGMLLEVTPDAGLKRRHAAADLGRHLRPALLRDFRGAEHPGSNNHPPAPGGRRFPLAGRWPSDSCQRSARGDPRPRHSPRRSRRPLPSRRRCWALPRCRDRWSPFPRRPVSTRPKRFPTPKEAHHKSWLSAFPLLPHKDSKIQLGERAARGGARILGHRLA